MGKKGGNISPETQWKKGQSGNPNGRPKKIPALDKLLEEIPESDYQSVINKLIAKAKSGDVRAAEVVLDRAYGKAKQRIEVEATEDQLFVIGGKQIKF